MRQIHRLQYQDIVGFIQKNIRHRICCKILFKNICNQVLDLIVNPVTVIVNPVTKKFSIALFATTILHYLCFVHP